MLSRLLLYQLIQQSCSLLLHSTLISSYWFSWPPYFVQSSNHSLLDLLRKYHLHHIFNFLPEHIHASSDPRGHKGICLCLLLVAQIEVAVGPALRHFARIHFNPRCLQHKLLRVEQVEDGDWVVVGRKWPLLGPDVEVLVVKQHVVESLAEGMTAVCFEPVVDLFIGQEQMGAFEGNHHKLDAALDLQHSLKSQRIAVDVELGRRGDVAQFYRTTHHHNLLNLGLDLREGHQEQTDVGE